MTTRHSKTARASKAAALVVLLALPMLSCGSSTTIVGAEVSAYIAGAFVEDTQAQLMPGSAPPQGSGPTASTAPSSEVITGGSTQVDLVGSGAFRTVALFVEGVDGHYLIMLPGDVTSATVVVTIAGRPPHLAFDCVFAVAGADGVFGAYATTSVRATQVAGGDIQVSVTWSTVADVDLHVIDPSGEEIYYGHRTSVSGGELDIDANAACSTSSFFQENIGWSPNTAPSGQYIVRVDYWDACGVSQTDFVVTVGLRTGVPAIRGLPGSGIQTFRGSYSGLGTQGGAGAGSTITTFTF